LTPVVGVVTMLAVTVVLASVAGAALIDDAAPSDPAPTVALSLSASTDRVSITHRGGEALDVSQLRVRVTVNGTRLAQQPPVPFFAATGFEPGPTGPFNAAADPTWTAGETATFAVAGTNRPTIGPDATLSVTIYRRDRLVAELTTEVVG
jgi:FlaG/FlaF family flagellin (archaellin)